MAELRLQAAEVRLDAHLHLGRHAEVITELQRLAASHPLREARDRTGCRAARTAVADPERRPGRGSTSTGARRR
ncbi:MAG TPA: BTAD domain-containing putative transcriptional regulator [Streptosporangiaceae bacterium]|nr:BTAD domain-containing putative transcriptional regulator [Streptosporangiaceae bacterium]